MQKREFKKKLFKKHTFAPYNKTLDNLEYHEFSRELSKWMKLSLNKLRLKLKSKVKSIDINWGEGELEILGLDNSYYYVKTQRDFFIDTDNRIYTLRPINWTRIQFITSTLFTIKYSTRYNGFRKDIIDRLIPKKTKCYNTRWWKYNTINDLPFNNIPEHLLKDIKNYNSLDYLGVPINQKITKDFIQSLRDLSKNIEIKL